MLTIIIALIGGIYFRSRPAVPVKEESSLSFAKDCKELFSRYGFVVKNFLDSPSGKEYTFDELYILFDKYTCPFNPDSLNPKFHK